MNNKRMEEQKGGILVKKFDTRGYNALAMFDSIPSSGGRRRCDPLAGRSSPVTALGCPSKETRRVACLHIQVTPIDRLTLTVARPSPGRRPAVARPSPHCRPTVARRYPM